MREWMMFGIGAAIGIVIGIVLAETYGLSNVSGKLVTMACMTLGGGLTLGMGKVVGWLRSDVI